MSYKLYILQRAQKELFNLPEDSYGRLRASIKDLANDPRQHGCSKLAGREGWRIRIGKYRVIYEIDDDGQKVTILHVGHRRDVYR